MASDKHTDKAVGRISANAMASAGFFTNVDNSYGFFSRFTNYAIGISNEKIVRPTMQWFVGGHTAGTWETEEGSRRFLPMIFNVTKDDDSTSAVGETNTRLERQVMFARNTHPSFRVAVGIAQKSVVAERDPPSHAGTHDVANSTFS